MYDYADVVSLYKKTNIHGIIMKNMPGWVKLSFTLSIFFLLLLFVNLINIPVLENNKWIRFVSSLSYLFLLIFSLVSLYIYLKLKEQLFGPFYKKYISLFEMPSRRKFNLRGLLLRQALKDKGYYQLPFIQCVLEQLEIVLVDDKPKTDFNSAFFIAFLSNCLFIVWQVYHGYALSLIGSAIIMIYLTIIYVLYIASHEGDTKLLMQLQKHLKYMVAFDIDLKESFSTQQSKPLPLDGLKVHTKKAVNN